VSSIITFAQPNKAIVGRNAFAHEAGLHQDGPQGKNHYEIIDPASACRRQAGAGQAQRPARSNQRARELGFSLSKAEFGPTSTLFTAVADHRKKGSWTKKSRAHSLC